MWTGGHIYQRLEFQVVGQAAVAVCEVTIYLPHHATRQHLIMIGGENVVIEVRTMVVCVAISEQHPDQSLVAHPRTADFTVGNVIVYIGIVESTLYVVDQQRAFEMCYTHGQ